MSLFICDKDLANLLLNITNTILKVNLLPREFEEDENRQCVRILINVMINCWVDPTNILITYIITEYDDSPLNTFPSLKSQSTFLSDLKVIYICNNLICFQLQFFMTV